MFNGRIDLALAGYNAGENAVIKHGYALPLMQKHALRPADYRSVCDEAGVLDDRTSSE